MTLITFPTFGHLPSLDQEGGLVDRLRRIATPMPSANRIKNSSQADQFGSLIAETVRILGFNMDFAPVVDVVDQNRSSVSNGLHSRAFGTSAEETTELAGAFLNSLKGGGILGCLKHFPGLGGLEVDSHEDLPAVGINIMSFAQLTSSISTAFEFVSVRPRGHGRPRRLSKRRLAGILAKMANFYRLPSVLLRNKAFASGSRLQWSGNNGRLGNGCGR